MLEQEKPEVFVVDDEQVICWTLAAILNQSGFSATAFTDPLGALSSAKTSCPQFLISDVKMPKMNGVELGIEFKTLNSDCKILLFSGQASTLDLLETARERGHDFVLLAKPIHPSDLLAAIRKV